MALIIYGILIFIWFSTTLIVLRNVRGAKKVGKHLLPFVLAFLILSGICLFFSLSYFLQGYYDVNTPLPNNFQY